MGNSQSLFYPDNPSRRTRAQQLADDCQSFQHEYEKIKAEVETELGPYKEKVAHVLHAFGCRNLDDLDKLVHSTTVGENLEKWKEIKSTVDGLDTASEVFSTAMAVVAIAGIAISIVGALAGGFGFFAGLAVTANILLIMGVIGAIFDAISGAIQRSQLRDAINSLYPSRIKIKLIQINISGIKKLYAIFEKAGYNKDTIIKELREGDVMSNLQESAAAASYYEVAKGLVEHDRTRPGGAWTNEDPGWENIARSLDTELAAKKLAARANAFAFNPTMLISASAASPRIATSTSHIQPMGLMANNLTTEYQNDEMRKCDRSLSRLEYMKDHGMDYKLPLSQKTTAQITVVLQPKDSKTVSPLLQGPMRLSLESFLNATAAVVHVQAGTHGTLQADTANLKLSTEHGPKAPTDWIISFANAAEASSFAGKRDVDSESSQSLSVEVSLRIETPDALYIAADGTLRRSPEESISVFVARYA
ncbi:hypothetical protein MVEN_01082800 [Mycena venus]|uniref:Uncharacterized protein n=1 Tax=Mycena venus TaxID=2733690 RepID=A0A8H7CXA5_9AGAR|nr:hypothetical protein MVEN_01082800 [Mycena venus]